MEKKIISSKYTDEYVRNRVYLHKGISSINKLIRRWFIISMMFIKIGMSMHKLYSLNFSEICCFFLLNDALPLYFRLGECVARDMGYSSCQFQLQDVFEVRELINLLEKKKMKRCILLFT